MKAQDHIKEDGGFPQFLPYDLTYRQDTTWLDKIWNSRWRRKKLKDSAYKTKEEIEILRKRCYSFAVEVAEWRLKVGHAHYSRLGPEFAQDVYEAMRARGAYPIRLTDDDFSRRPK